MTSLPSPPGSDPYRQTLRALRPGVLAAAGLSAVISLLMLTGSVYMLQVYDRVLASGSVPTLLGLFAVVVVLYGFLGFYDFLRARLLSRLALQLDARLGPQLFRDGLGRKTQGLRDLDLMRGFLSGPAVAGLFDLPWVPLYLAVLFLVHPWLGWLTIAGAGVVAVLAWLGHRLSRTPMATSMTGEALARDFAERSQRNAEMIVAMGMQDQISQRWRQLQDAALAAGQRAGSPGEVIGASSRAFRMLMQSAILTLGAWLVIQGEMSGGMIIASSILTGRALGPVDQVIGQWRGIGRALESHRRLQGFFSQHSRPAPGVALPDPAAHVVVRNLVKYAPESRASGGFAAATDRPRLLDDISFDLQPGDALGVIGASASGKSTLARLLAGAWTADGGEIRLDGATRDQWDPARLGRHIGYLPQQVDLLPGTLRDNIARFDPAVSDQAVMEAARAAGVHDMILHLADGYATPVGSQAEAAPLSGGQVQRIGLARALCGNPALVILDEPNSNLDVAGETCLIAAITALRARGAAVIVMAHRPNVLLATNKLLILDQGRLVRFGPRDALIDATPAPAPAVSPSAPLQTAPDAAPRRSRPPGASPDLMRQARLSTRRPADLQRVS